MNQTERLLNFLERNQHIDPMMAWVQLGIYRLGARVYDLRHLGHNILSTRITIRNQFGEKVRVASYTLQQKGTT